MGLHRLGDDLGPLQGLRHPLRRLGAADRVAPDGTLADLIALRLQPFRDFLVGIRCVEEQLVKLFFDLLRELRNFRGDSRASPLRH